MASELQKTVVGLDVVERRLQSSANSGSSGDVITHEGCVATTSDGQKYLIEKGVAPDGMEELRRIGGKQGSRIVKLGAKMPQGFSVVKKVSVVVKDATLLAVLEASGDDYNWLCNNCWNSTQSMQQVVTGELGLPWQLKAGVGAGIVAVVAMVLFAIGRNNRNQNKH